MYGLEDMTDLVKFVIKYFKANSDMTWFVLSSPSNILVKNKIRKNKLIKKRKNDSTGLTCQTRDSGNEIRTTQ
jgi:UDP-N-acetylenolpyruvoylglucosamine reductase